MSVSGKICCPGRGNNWPLALETFVRDNILVAHNARMVAAIWLAMGGDG